MAVTLVDMWLHESLRLKYTIKRQCRRKYFLFSLFLAVNCDVNSAVNNWKESFFQQYKQNKP